MRYNDLIGTARAVLLCLWFGGIAGTFKIFGTMALSEAVDAYGEEILFLLFFFETGISVALGVVSVSWVERKYNSIATRFMK